MTEPTPHSEPPHPRGLSTVVGTAAGITLGLATAVVLLLLITLGITTGWFGDVVNQDQYQDRMDAIGAVYRQGQQVRRDFTREGISMPTDGACVDAYYRTGAYHDVARMTPAGKPDTAFANLRRLAFVNGCQGRPNVLPPVPLDGTAPAVSASPSSQPK